MVDGDDRILITFYKQAMIARRLSQSLRNFANYAPGTKIPVNIMKGKYIILLFVLLNVKFADGKDPVILEDKEYPEWLFKLTDPVSY